MAKRKETKKLQLNAQPINKGGFTLPKKKKFVFKPTKEALKFITEFSEKWKTMDAGNGSYYISENRKYCIMYSELMDTRQLSVDSKTPVSVNIVSKMVLVSRKILLKHKADSDMVFYLLIWALVRPNVPSIMEADQISIKYYGETGRPLKKIIPFWAKIFSDNPTNQNVDRFKVLSKAIKSKKR